MQDTDVLNEDTLITCTWKKDLTIGVAHELVLRSPRLGSPTVRYVTTAHYPNQVWTRRYMMKIHLYLDGQFYDEGISSNYWAIGLDGTDDGIELSASRDRKDTTYTSGDFVRVTVYNNQGTEVGHTDLSLAGKSSNADTVSFPNYYWA